MSRCADGHAYHSAAALDEPTKTAPVLQHFPESQQKYARMWGTLWVLGKEPEGAFGSIIAGLGEALANVQGQIGPLAIAVSSHHLADQLADIFCALKGPYDQGVRVIPFGASPLSYCGPGALLFRAIVIVPPREGPLALSTFMAWADNAFRPYLSPNAAKVIL